MKHIFFLIFNHKYKYISLAGLAILSGCGDDEAAIAAAQREALVGNKIECALNGSDSFLQNCATERVASDNGTILLIRHSDGGFRRFRILTDGRGLETAEGFDDSKFEIIDDKHIILTSGIDRYKLKAQFTGGNSNASSDNAQNAIEGEAANDSLENNGSAPILSDSDVGPIGRPGVPYAIPK